MTERIAIITGGSRGLGRNTAINLAKRGVDLIFTWRVNEQEAESLVRECEALGRRAAGFRLDTGEIPSFDGFVEEVARTLQRWGRERFDYLVNNAGNSLHANFSETSEEQFDSIFNVHVKGCFHTTKFAIPAMLVSGGGAVVIVSSVQGFTAMANSAAYVAAKHALLGITRSIALDFAQQNIRANCVCPGTIDTPMLHRSAERTGSPQKVIDICSRMHAMGRIGRPEEVANAIAFLASDCASFITGTTLVVDGGLLIPTGGTAFQKIGIDTGDEGSIPPGN